LAANEPWCSHRNRERGQHAPPIRSSSSCWQTRRVFRKSQERIDEDHEQARPVLFAARHLREYWNREQAQWCQAYSRCGTQEILFAAFSCGGVRILAESGSVTFGEDFHHPAIKVIDRVVHDGLESTIVLAMSFLNVVFQSDAEIPVFAAQLDLFRT